MLGNCSRCAHATLLHRTRPAGRVHAARRFFRVPKHPRLKHYIRPFVLRQKGADGSFRMVAVEPPDPLLHTALPRRCHARHAHTPVNAPCRNEPESGRRIGLLAEPFLYPVLWSCRTHTPTVAVHLGDVLVVRRRTPFVPPQRASATMVYALSYRVDKRPRAAPFRDGKHAFIGGSSACGATGRRRAPKRLPTELCDVRENGSCQQPAEAGGPAGPARVGSGPRARSAPVARC